MSPWVLLAIAVAVPPLGIVLLWTRSRAGVFRKLLGSLALVLLSFAHLHYFFGLRAELDGTGARPIFSFQALYTAAGRVSPALTHKRRLRHASARSGTPDFNSRLYEVALQNSIVMRVSLIVSTSA